MCISDNRKRHQVKSSAKHMLISNQSAGALCTPAPGAGTACGVHSCVADDLPPAAAVGWFDPNSPVAGRPSSGRDVPPSCPSHPQNRAGILPAGHLLPNWGRVNLDRTALKAPVRTSIITSTYDATQDDPRVSEDKEDCPEINDLRQL